MNDCVEFWCSGSILYSRNNYITCSPLMLFQSQLIKQYNSTLLYNLPTYSPACRNINSSWYHSKFTNPAKFSIIEEWFRLYNMYRIYLMNCGGRYTSSFHTRVPELILRYNQRHLWGLSQVQLYISCLHVRECLWVDWSVSVCGYKYTYTILHARENTITLSCNYVNYINNMQIMCTLFPKYINDVAYVFFFVACCLYIKFESWVHPNLVFLDTWFLCVSYLY